MGHPTGATVLRRTRLVVPVLLLAVGACSRGEETAPEGVVTWDSAGVRIIESHTSAWGKVRTLGSDPLVEIGSREGSEAAALGLLADAKLLGPGTIAATDSRANEIRLFDVSGEHLHTFGGSGAGPNEFRGIGRVHRYPGDSLAAFDFGLSRTLIVPVGGGDARAVSAIVGDGRAPLLEVLSSGSLLSYRSIPVDPSAAGGTVWDTTAVVLIDRSGDEWREIRRVPDGPAPGTPTRVLAAHSVLVGHPDGFYWARTDRYEIQVFDSLGVLRSLIRRPVEPIPVTPDDQRDYADATLKTLREEGREASARRLERTFQESGYAATRPLFWAGFVDADRRLWISHWPWPARYAPPDRWSVFSPEGRWLGDVQARDGMMIHDARGDTVLVQWRDEYDVPYLRLYRLSGSS
jgi:hypothetical protein